MLRSFYYSFLILIIINLDRTSAQDATLSVPLNKTITFVNKELYGDFVYINRSSTLQVALTAASKNISFIIFQVHSHLYNVILFNNTLTKQNYANGTNVGLYGLSKPKFDTYYIWNPNDLDLKVYISVHGYGAKDPVPGGCNMEFPLPVTPYLSTMYTKDYIYVDAASAKDPKDVHCTKTDVTVAFFQMYLPEGNFDIDIYFKGIQNMLTIDLIEENGEEVPADAFWKMRRMLSAYPGTGAIFVAVAYNTLNMAYSVYVPTYSYACSPLDDDCDLIDDVLPQFLCASLLFIGLFICYFGHKFFKTEMFLTGLGTGFIITYILISITADLSPTALTAASALCGIFFGAIWLLFWWFYGIPFLAVILPLLNLGFLFAAIIYYRTPGGVILLQNDFNFWSLFIFLMLLLSMSLVTMTLLSNILCCAVLGAFATVYPIDYYVGSNLKYIMINTVRRATVPKFNRAVLAPPFQWRDILVTLIWVMLAITGFLYQHYQNRSRPPFPPPPRSISPRMPGEFANSNRGRRYGTIAASIESGQSANPTDFNNERTALLA